MAITVELPLSQGPRSFTLRPSFTGIGKVETRLGQGILAIAARVARRRVGVVDVAVILDETIAEPGKPPYDELGAAVLQAGLRSFLPPLTDLMVVILNGAVAAKDGGAAPLPFAIAANAAGGDDSDVT